MARSLFAEPVDVLAIWTGYCGCGCGAELDITSKWDAYSPPPGYPVIAHILARGSRGEHTAANVSIWTWRCNREAARREAGEVARVKRFEVVRGRAKSGKIASRGFQRGPKRKWASRPFPKKS